MMPPKGKWRSSQTLPPDIISSLPENLIDAILMCLRFRDAVRTSILSRKWRYKWCRLPDLTLDKTVWETRKGLIYHPNKMTNIISHILILHEGPITKFTLCVPGSRSCPKIDDLIYFLSRNGIQHLVLRLTDDYQLPSSFFSCLQLRHLTLQHCYILPPPDFYGFDRLVRLELYAVEISSKLLGSLISHCLFLEHLVLYYTFPFSDVIEINAPKLRSFDFTGRTSNICLKNIPFLAKFSLTYALECDDIVEFDLVKFFESLSAVEHLLLNDMLFAQDVVEVPRRLPFNLNSVKHLDISVDMLDQHEISCALCLIRSYPYLQYLKIQGYVRDVDDIPALECLEVGNCSDVTLDHLREVELVLTFGGCIREMQLAKLLLAKSPVLERMLFVLCRDKESARVKILAELKELQSASPKADIVIG